MQIERLDTDIPGCYELRPSIARDSRGYFVKTFHRLEFEKLGLATAWAEQFYSVSSRGVVRGLHLQLPPYEQAKLIYCTAGHVLDVAVDARRGSPTFGRHLRVELEAARGNMVYLPPGVAHGFYTRSELATLVYSVTSLHAPGHDCGIRWDSAGIDWPEGRVVISDRDRMLPPLERFDSPFEFSNVKIVRP